MVHCIGVIDGKHVAIECPKNSGSLYYNYKGFFSIVLMAVCDARYCFTLVNVGNFGSNNDSGMLAKSSMGKRFEEQKINVPNAKSLLGYAEDKLPFFLVGDEIFPPKTWLMRPYPGNLSLGQKILITAYQEHDALSKIPLGSWLPDGESFVNRSKLKLRMPKNLL